MGHGDHQLKISQLKAFVAVANCGNFSTAALDLGLTQSTISHAIATLEEDLGVVLLLRGRHGATLTPEGEQILVDARQVLQLLDSIRQKAQAARGLESGLVRIATVRSIATHVLPQMIVQFRAKFPQIRVAIAEYDRYVEVEQALRDGQADVGFTALPTSEDFEVRELFHDEFLALLPPQSLADQGELTWETLVSHPLIVNSRSYQHNKAIRDHLTAQGHTLRVDYEVREDSTIISMVRQGLGASIMARLTAEPIPADLVVRPLPVPLHRVMGVATLANALLPQAAFVFLDILQAVSPAAGLTRFGAGRPGDRTSPDALRSTPE